MKNPSDPIRGRSVNNHNLESVSFAFDRDTRRVIDMHINAKGSGVLAGCGTVAKAFHVLGLVHHTSYSDAVGAHPAFDCERASIGGRVDPKLVSATVQIARELSSAAAERFVVDEQPQQPRKARLAGNVASVADQSVVKVERDAHAE